MFQKGQSGNPNGRPRPVTHHGILLQELARRHTARAISTLAAIMSNSKATHTARVSAAIALLDRGYGKPAQAITGPDGGPLVIEVVRFASNDPALPAWQGPALQLPAEVLRLAADDT